MAPKCTVIGNIKELFQVVWKIKCKLTVEAFNLHKRIRNTAKKAPSRVVAS